MRTVNVMKSPHEPFPSAHAGQSCIVVDQGRWRIVQRSEVAGEPIECTRAQATTWSAALGSTDLPALVGPPGLDLEQVTDIAAECPVVATCPPADLSLTPVRACACDGGCGGCHGTGFVPEQLVMTVIDPAGEVLTCWVDPRDLPVHSCRDHANCVYVEPAAPVQSLLNGTFWGMHNSVALSGAETGWAGLRSRVHLPRTEPQDLPDTVDRFVRAMLAGVDHDGDWSGGPWGGVSCDHAGRVVSWTVRLIARTDAQAALAQASHDCAYALVPERFDEDLHWTLYRAVENDWVEIAGGWDPDEVMHAALVPHIPDH